MHVANRDDWVIIISVLSAVICIYGSSFFILARALLLPRDRKVPIGPVGWAVLLAATTGIGCLGYASFVEPYTLGITNINLALPNLKSPCTIVQISDLHCDPTPRLEGRVLEEISKIKPDAVLFTGDAINSLDALPQFKAFAKKLAQLAPVYCIMGDWDWAFIGKNPYPNTGWTLLTNRSIVLHIRDNTICLIGVASGSPSLPVIQRAPHMTPTILLVHNPDADVVLQKETRGIDLYLCGHTHGGQIALPVYGALITQSVQGKKYESGLHKLNDMYLYTNRGIGMEGHFPRLRFFAQPELAVFHVTRKS